MMMVMMNTMHKTAVVNRDQSDTADRKHDRRAQQDGIVHLCVNVEARKMKARMTSNDSRSR